MTELTGVAVVDLLDPGPEGFARWEAERKRIWEECWWQVALCHLEVWAKLNRDQAATWRLFNSFAKAVKPPPKTRGKANPDRDARLLAAYDNAPKGEREAAVGVAAGARTTKQLDAAWKQAKRLVATRGALNKKDEEIRQVLLRGVFTGMTGDEIVAAIRAVVDK